MFTNTEKIIHFFNVNEELFNQCIEELDNYNGYLGDDRYYPMYELEDFYVGVELSEILDRVFFGYDEDTYNTDSSGNREHGQFNPNRNYFCYNGYGNLVSSDYKDYSAYLDNYAVEAMADNIEYIDTINDTPELLELFNEYEAERRDGNE